MGAKRQDNRHGDSPETQGPSEKDTFCCAYVCVSVGVCLLHAFVWFIALILRKSPTFSDCVSHSTWIKSFHESIKSGKGKQLCITKIKGFEDARKTN